MSEEVDLTGYEYIGKAPYSKTPDMLALDSKEARFVLHRTKRKKSYQVVFDTHWSEVVSFDCCEVNYAKDDKSWPLDDDPLKDMEVIGPAGMLFIFLKPTDQNFFQIHETHPEIFMLYTLPFLAAGGVFIHFKRKSCGYRKKTRPSRTAVRRSAVNR